MLGVSKEPPSALHSNTFWCLNLLSFLCINTGTVLLTIYSRILILPQPENHTQISMGIVCSQKPCVVVHLCFLASARVQMCIYMSVRLDAILFIFFNSGFQFFNFISVYLCRNDSAQNKSSFFVIPSPFNWLSSVEKQFFCNKI